MADISVEQFKTKVDSLYRLVLVASRRAAQLSRPDTRSLVSTRSKKPTVIALQEILEDKVAPVTHSDDEENIEQ